MSFLRSCVYENISSFTVMTSKYLKPIYGRGIADNNINISKGSIKKI